MATCSRACQPCGLSSRGAISDQELGKLRKRRCNTRTHHQYSARVARPLKSPYFRRHVFTASGKVTMGLV